MADINEIISKAGIGGVVTLRDEVEKANLAIQDTIISSKKLSDTLAGAKTMGQLNKDTQALTASQEKLLKLTAQRQLSEERLAAFQIKEAQRAEAIAANRLAAEQKQIAADNARIAVLERKANAAFKANAADSNGGTIGSGTTVNSSDISGGLAASQAAAIPVIKQNTNATKENADAKKRLAFEALQAKEAEKANALTLKNSVKESNAAKGSLDQRSAALLRLRKTYSGLNDQERSSPFGTRLLGITQRLDTQVKDLDKSLGNSQRNVGNYGSAFGRAAGKAFSGLRTIANILPGVGLAGLIGFAVGPIIEYVSQLDVFKKKVDELNQARQALNSVNLKGAQDAQTEIVQLKVLYDTAKNTTLSQEQRYNAAKKLQDLYPKTFANFSIEQIELGKVDKAYLSLSQAILATARARASEAKIAENSARQLSDEEMITEERINNQNILSKIVIAERQLADARRKGTTNENTGINNDAVTSLTRLKNLQNQLAASDKIITDASRDREILNKRNLALTENIVKQQKKGAEIAEPSKTSGKKPKDRSKEIEKQAMDNAAARIQIEIDAEQKIADIYKKQADNENFSLETRLDSLQKYNDKALEIADLQADKESFGKKLSADEELANASNLAKKREEIQIGTGEAIVKITRDYATQAEQIRMMQSQRELTELEKQRDIALTNIASLYNEKGDFSVKAEEEYQSKRAEIENKYSLQSIRKQIDQADIELAILRTKGFDITDQEAKIAALRLKYQDETTKNAEKNADKQLKKEQEKAERIKEIAQEVFDFARSLTNSIFEGNIQQIEKEKKANEDKKNLDIENVNESILSEEDKQQRIAVINAQAEQQEIATNARIAAIKRKQAIADKVFALGQIAINTAIAVSKVAAQTGIFALAGIGPIIALGALQAAAVLATPIPAFEKGGTMRKDGLARFSEKGQELRLNPDGSAELTPKNETVGFVKAGTKFISAADTKRLMAKPSGIDVAGKSWDISPMLAEQRNSTSRIEKAVNKIELSNTNITKGGWFAQQTKVTKQKNYLKNHFG